MTEQFQSVPGEFDLNTVFWTNGSGESVPDRAIVKATSYNPSQNLYTALKPDGEDGLFFLNGPVAVPDSGVGTSRWTFQPQIVRTSESSVQVGDILGPVDDSWEVSAEGKGYIAASGVSGGMVAVIPSSSPGRVNFVPCVLSSPLSKAVDALSTPSTASARIADPVSEGSSQWTLGDTITVYNHSESADFETNTFGFAVLVDGFYRFLGDCDPMSNPPLL